MNTMDKYSQLPDEYFLIAKEVCLGNAKSSSDNSIFNKVYTWMDNYLSKVYHVSKDYYKKDEIPHNLEYKIVMPSDSNETDNNPDNLEKTYIEPSNGEFILHSLRKWNPEKAKYLTFVRFLLFNCKYRVSINASVEKEKALRNARRLFKEKYGIESDKEARVYITTHYKEISAENRESYMYIFSESISLDKPLHLDDDEDFTLLDTITDNDSQDEIPESFDLFLELLFKEFSNAQARTKPCLSIYITVQVYKALYLFPHKILLDYVAKYPEMLNSNLFEWIEKTIETNRLVQNTIITNAKFFPSSSQQAEKSGKELHSYLNTIKRYKKALSSSLKNIFPNYETSI